MRRNSIALPPLLTFLLLAPLAAGQQAATLAEIREEGLQRSQVMQMLDELANGIGPRLTGSNRLNQAADWAVEKFRSFGLEVKKEQWGEIAVGFNRGPWRGAMTSPRRMDLTFGTGAWTIGTRGRQSGKAVLGPKTPEDWEQLKGAVKDLWIVAQPARRPDTTGMSSEERRALRAKRREWRRRSLASFAEAGALGVIRSTGSELVRTRGNYRTKWGEWAPIPQINLVKSQFEVLLEDLKQGQEVELEFDIRNYFQKGPIPVYNVIADLKGTEKPDEYVVVGGHLDSWDGATGTTDNGTGTTSTLEAARILTASGAKPRRTIRFMLWSGEEQGLLGSRAWCNEHQDLMEKISACFVHDMGTNYVSGLTVTEAQFADFETICAPVIGLSEEMPFKLRKARRGLGGGGGSDHASFLAKGVPGFFWAQSGRAKYGYGWHTQNDTFDIAIPEYQRHTATVVATIAYGVANLDHLLSRKNLRSTRRTIPQRRVLGITDLDAETMTVRAVRENSVAARAGVMPGDVLVSLDGVRLKDRFTLRNAMQTEKTRRTLVVKRSGKEVTLTLEFQRRRGRRRDG